MLMQKEMSWEACKLLRTCVQTLLWWWERHWQESVRIWTSPVIGIKKIEYCQQINSFIYALKYFFFNLELKYFLYFRVPLGVCAGIAPFNFPAMIPLWMFPTGIKMIITSKCNNNYQLRCHLLLIKFYLPLSKIEARFLLKLITN